MPMHPPVSGLGLLEQERRNRESLQHKKPFITGCSEIDEQVLGKGFEAGTVFGVSAEDDEFGMLVRYYC